MEDAVRRSVTNTLSRHVGNGTPDYWKEPLVGFADARSPLFGELKEMCCPEHKVPSDYLPGARTVVSYFLPFREFVSKSNLEAGRPSDIWVDAYNTTNRLAIEANEALVGLFSDLGYKAAVPIDAGILINQTYSAWSQRHVAWIAGLGTFGLNNMLITEKGCCGRFFSVITDMELPCGSPLETERCRGQGCGACMRRCPVGALEPDGFVRSDCYGVCMENQERYGADVCGKCVVGLPCTHRIP